MQHLGWDRPAIYCTSDTVFGATIWLYSSRRLPGEDWTAYLSLTAYDARGRPGQSRVALEVSAPLVQDGDTFSAIRPRTGEDCLTGTS